MNNKLKIKKIAVFYLIAIIALMAITSCNSNNASITGFAVLDENATNETAITQSNGNQTAAETTAINETPEETKEKPEKEAKEEKPKPEKEKGPNVPPVWKSDVNEFTLYGTTAIDLNNYFYDENNDTITYTSTSPDKISAAIENSIVTLIPDGNNFTTTIEFAATDGDKTTKKEVNLIVPEKSIAINLQYKPGTIYDTDDNGNEATIGAIDFTVENSQFSWDVNETNLCARWEVYSVESGESTTVCYGSEKCCAFVGLGPTKDIWDEPLYLTYGQYDSTLNNVVSSQLIYVDYGVRNDKPYVEIYNSQWQNLSANYYFASIDFENVCIDTCVLEGFNETSYRLIFEIDNAILNLDTLTYSIVEEITRVPVSLAVQDDEGIVSGSFTLYKNNEPVAIVEEFVEPDYYNIEILPTENVIDKLVIENADITKPLTATIGIDSVAREISIENVDVKKRYAVDLEQLDFEKATLTATAAANSLFKCKQWDYDSEVCFGSWEKIKDLIEGQQYELTLTANDPGFIEGNSNITIAPANITNLTGLELIKDIPNITVAANSNATIDLSEYFSNIDESTIFTYFEQDNISIVFENSIATIAPPKDFIGTSYTYITAAKGAEVSISNVFSINVVNITGEIKDCSDFIMTDDGQYYCADDEKFYSCKGFEKIDTGNEDIGDLTRCKEAKFLRDTVDKSMCPFRHKDCNVTVDMNKGWGAKQSDEKSSYKLSTFHENFYCDKGHCEIPFYFKSNISLEGNLTFDSSAHLELRNISVERVLQNGAKEKHGKKVSMRKDDSYYYMLYFDYTPEWTSPTGIRRMKPLKFNITASLDGEKILELDPIAEAGSGSSGFPDCDNSGDYPTISLACTAGDMVIVAVSMDDAGRIGPISWNSGAESDFSMLGDVGTSGTSGLNVTFWNNTCASTFAANNLVVTVAGGNGDDCAAVAVRYSGVANVRKLVEKAGIATSVNLSVGDGSPAGDNAINSDEWAVDVYGSDVSVTTDYGNNNAVLTLDAGTAVAGVSDCTYAEGGSDGTCDMNWSGATREGMIASVLVPVPAETTPPRINASLDDSRPVKGQVVNMTANVSDNQALSTCNFFMNGTSDGSTIILNKSVTGTSDQCSQNWTIDLPRNSIINFTVRVNDADGNFNLSVNSTADGQIGQVIRVRQKADVSGGSYENLTAQACNKENLSTTKGTFDLICSALYPGSCITGSDGVVNCNDGLSEQFTSSATTDWGGINISVYNDLITDCEDIAIVDLCYEWWASATTIQDCDISVDADGGASYTAATTTCPGAVADPGVTCTDVSSLETWTCGSFFGESGTRAMAKANGQKASAGGTRTFTVDALWFNVTYRSTVLPPDTTPPVINGTLNNTAPQQGMVVNATYNATDVGGGLDICQFIMNGTSDGSKIILNYTFPTKPKKGQCSQNWTIDLAEGSVINFTAIVNDTSTATAGGNKKQNETTITVAATPDNTPPVVNTTFNITSPLVDSVINFSGNITDNVGLSTANITYNMSGVLTKANYTISSTRAEINNVTAITGCAEACVINFTMYATDTNNNVRQNSTLVVVRDVTVPVVNTTFNNSNPLVTDVINYTGNVTDLGGLLSANITYNMSGVLTKANYTLSGTSARVTNTTQITGCAEACVINYTLFVTDTSNNVRQNSTLVVVADVTRPVVNTSFNVTSPVQNDVINFSGNITDGVGLLTVNITNNQSGVITYANYSVSGTRAEIHNVTTITTGAGSVINFTMYATDVNNNVRQNSTLVVVRDATFPVVNTSFNVTSALFDSVINFSGNITDDVGLSTANITYNMSGAVTYANYTISGTRAEIHNATAITGCVETCVINFTMYATDTSNNVRQNSTLVVVADVTRPVVNTSFNKSLQQIEFNDVINISANITDASGLLSANITNNMSGVITYANYTISGTSASIHNITAITCNECVINFTVYATDTNNNVKQNSTLVTVTPEKEAIACSNLDIPNANYTLVNDVASAGTCFYILADNVTLDCKGFEINYSQSVIGYGVNISSFNYSTIRSCNIVQADIASDTSNSYGVYVFKNASNSIIFNNTMITRGSNGYGVYLFQEAYNNSVYDNSIVTSGSTGYGVRLFSTAYNNNVYSNNITTSGDTGYGVYLFSTAYNNNVYSNIITTSGDTGYGVYLVSTAYNNNVYSNNITTSNTFSYGIYLNINARNNTIYDNNITTLNTVSSYGIYLLRSVNNNTFYRNTISSLAIGVLVNGTGQTTAFNTFNNDTIVPCTTGCASDYQDIVLTANATDIIFTNVSMNKSRIAFVPRDLDVPVEKNNLTVKWFLDVNVTKSTDNTALQGAEVVINDSFAFNVFTGNTDAEGGISTIEVTEFTMNGSTNSSKLFTSDTCVGIDNVNITCFTPYNITVNLTGYNRILTSVIVNRTRFVNISLSPDTTAPVVNTSFNVTTALFDSVINFSGNITDETGLATANITYNLSGVVTYANYTISGTSASIHNITTLTCTETCVVNFTMYATDTNNNVRQNSTLLVVADVTRPVVNTSFNVTSPVQNDVINFSGNITDGIGLLTVNITNNQSGVITYANYSVSGTRAEIHNVTTITTGAGSVINFTMYATDVNNNVRQNSTLIVVRDATFPVVNTSFNVTNAVVNDVINFSGNITDDLNLLSANITYNMSGAVTKANYTISGTRAEIHNVTAITGCVETCVINFTMYATDTNNNVKQNSTLIVVADATRPVVNTTFNVTLPVQNDVINFSGNITDGVGLLTVNITYNQSGVITYANYTVSGTSAQIHNITAITTGAGSVINFTMYATDTSNNVRQNSTLIVVADRAAPVVNTSFNVTSALFDSVINFSGNITDETGLSTANITYNMSGAVTYANYTISGTRAEIHNVTAITGCVETCVINFTMYATDTSNNVKQNSTLIVVADATRPVVNTTFNVTSPVQNDVINFSGNITDGVGLLSANITYNVSGTLTKINFSGLSGNSASVHHNATLNCAETCVINFTMYATDTSNNVRQNSTLIVVADVTSPVINTSLNVTTALFDSVINFSGNITDGVGLLSANITYNLSGVVTYANYTISGTSANIHNITTITGCVETCVINFTMYATDTNNNVKQNSTLVVVAGALPRINASIDDGTPFFNSRVNMTANVSDNYNLSFCQFIDNQSLANGAKQFINKTVTGTSDRCSQNYTIALDAGGVINFTVIVNDTSNNINQTSQVVEVNSTNLLGCEDLDVANVVYNLTQDVASAGTCMYVLANNVTLDCHGFEINYSQSVVGYGINISSYNYSTIRSCNIVQADIASDTLNSYGVYVFNKVKNTTVYNNTIMTQIGSNGYGIYLFSNSNNNNVYSNTITTSGGAGYGVNLFSNSNNNSVYSNTITTSRSSGRGVNLGSNSENNNVYSNNITTRGGDAYGALLDSNSDNNNVYSNNITTKGGTGVGVYLGGVSNNSVYSNTITTSGSAGYGALLDSSSNNNVYSNNITTSNTSSYGIYLNNKVYNNTFYDNNITTKNTTGSYGIYMLDKVSNNTFYRNTISSLVIGILFNGTNIVTPRVSPNVYSNTFTNDTIIPCSEGCAADYKDIVLTANATDITFTNVSMNKSRIAFVPRDLAVPVEKNNLTVQWFLSVNVTNSTNNIGIANAQVNINDSFATNVFDGLTDITGGIATQTVKEFTMNGSVPFTVGTDTCTDVRNNVNITCFSPYNISVNTSDVRNFTSVDVNRSKFVNVSFGVGAGTPAANAPIIKLNNATSSQPSFSLDPVSGSSAIILISFNVTDADGVATINASKTVVNLTLGGLDGQFRFNISDQGGEFGTCNNHTQGSVMIINCTVLMQYFDNASSIWVVNISVQDTSGQIGRNDTARFTYNTLSGISLPYEAVNFSSVFLGQQNVRAYPHLLINNTGNEDYDMVNMTAAALVGTTITTESIAVTNFYVNLTNTSNGDLALQFPADGVVHLRDPTTGGNISFIHGHTSAYSVIADKGNISAFIFVDVPSGSLSAQLYNATWNVTAINNP